jgi:hypothetical protein
MRSSITPGITRRAAPLIYVRAFVSAVGCMPLLGALAVLVFCALYGGGAPA